LGEAVTKKPLGALTALCLLFPLRHWRRTRINHEMALMPFIGRSFGNSHLYLGAGPALFGTQSKIIDATGFAEIHGTDLDVTGAPVNLSSSK
jgi:hypothetical protein